MGSLADCGLGEALLVAGEGGGIALVVFGPSLDALDGTDIGEGLRFSKLNFLYSAPALTGLKTGVKASRNFLYESGGVMELEELALPSSLLMNSDVAVRGLS